MDLTIEKRDLEDCQVELTVEVPNEQVNRAMRIAARQLSKRTRIPGFRPGKAPYDVVIRRFGEAAVLEEALDTLTQDIYRLSLDQEEIDPFAPGSLEEIVSKEPLILRYIIPLAPEVDLGNYQDLRIDYEEPVVEDEELEEAMEELRQSQALIEPVDRPAQLSDVVALKIHAELFDNGQENNQTLIDEDNIMVLVGEEVDWPFPDVYQHLLGMKAGADLHVEYTFLQDYSEESLRGKTADFRIHCLEVSSRTVPKWTDDLARSIGDFKDLLDLRIKVRKGLQEQVKSKTDSIYAQEVVEAVVEGAKVSYPPILLDEEVESMIQRLQQRLESQNSTLEEYLLLEGKSEEDFQAELKERASDRLKRSFVLSEVVQQENIEIEDGEIDTELDRLSTPFKDQAENFRKILDNQQGRRRVAMDLLSEKAVQRLMKIAQGKLQEPDLATSHGEKESEEVLASTDNIPKE